MKFIHSFYLGDCKDDMKIYINQICFVLSCLCIKKLGYDIDLHCDDNMYNYLKIAPYNNIYCDLNDLKQPKRIYAKSKFDVMSKEDLGNIHIDGDVFLLKNDIKNYLNFDEYDLIVQCKETRKNMGGYLWDESSYAFKNCEYPIWADRKCEFMYNCGVVGINNENLKSEYFETYYTMLQRYINNGIDLGSVPDIIIEQQFLYDLCNTRGYKVKVLLDEDDLDESARKLGYSHLMGPSKYNMREDILKMIYKLDKNIYLKIKEFWNGRIFK